MKDTVRFAVSIVVLLAAGAFVLFAPSSCSRGDEAPVVDHSQHQHVTHPG